ncbi:MAG: energy transducer TonB [Mucilaginibacter sp.]
MNVPKTFIALLVGMPCIISAHAQDTTKTKPPIFAVFDIEPAFPGGAKAFNKYIASNLKYPTVARLLGLTGKVYLTFIIERDGTVTNVKPVKCLGAGCESEAVRVVSMSPKWNPGSQNGRAVRVAYMVPITFYFEDDPGKTALKKLRKSEYGFAFFINGQTYSLDEAQQILGKSFDPATIETVEDLDDPKYVVPGKTANYLVIMKN